MAKALNQSRMRDSWVIVAVAAVMMFLTQPIFPVAALGHEIFDSVGFVLIIICALGRVYTSAFLGGFKNKTLIAHGPFSVVRNPLYFFSLTGVLGISLATAHPAVILFAPAAFAALYHFLIRREEKFLRENFGDEYAAYVQRVPRLIPDIRLYNTPETVEMKPRFLNNAIFDAIWWLISFQLLEVLETVL